VCFMKGLAVTGTVCTSARVGLDPIIRRRVLNQSGPVRPVLNRK
jgi:hypothetical protein